MKYWKGMRNENFQQILLLVSFQFSILEAFSAPYLFQICFTPQKKKGGKLFVLVLGFIFVLVANKLQRQ